MIKVVGVPHKEVRDMISRIRHGRVAYIGIYREPEKNITGIIGGPVLLATIYKLRHYMVGPKKDNQLDEKEVMAIAKYIADVVLNRGTKVDLIVIDCIYSINVARAIAFASNKSLGLIDSNEVSKDRIDSKVYRAMMGAYTNILNR